MPGPTPDGQRPERERAASGWRAELTPWQNPGAKSQSPTPSLKAGACPHPRTGRASAQGDLMGSMSLGKPSRDAPSVRSPVQAYASLPLRTGSYPSRVRGLRPERLVAVSDVPSAHRESTTRKPSGASSPCLKAGAPAPRLVVVRPDAAPARGERGARSRSCRGQQRAGTSECARPRRGRGPGRAASTRRGQTGGSGVHR